MYVEEEERIEKRAERVSDWLHYLHDLYADLISRPSEVSASESGFDATPDRRVCEHQSQWYRRKLCLACDNTGWRPLTDQEKDEDKNTPKAEDRFALDPYRVDLPRHRSVLNESDGTKRARQAAQMDYAIEALERAAQVQAGLEIQETVESRMFRLIGHKHHTLVRISREIRQFRDEIPIDIFRRNVDFDLLCLMVARVMEDTLRPAPS